jgi:CobQ-like glutamine amidotransferase family enzyme
MSTIRVGHLYPEYLNIYADRGNIAVFARRAAWRGHELEVTSIGMNDAIVPGTTSYIAVGDHEQFVVARICGEVPAADRSGRRNGAALLAVCGGTSYSVAVTAALWRGHARCWAATARDGRHDRRMIGDVLRVRSTQVRTDARRLENHAGRTPRSGRGAARAGRRRLRERRRERQ